LNGGNRVHEDVAYIPATDVYGNSTTGYWDNAATVPGCGNTNFIKISGAVSAANPYGGKPLLDHYTAGAASSGSPCGLLDNNIDLASANAAEDAAYRARTDGTYPVTVFSIGLGGAADIAPPQFLKHVANTIDSDLKASHSNEPIGKYIFVNGPGQLGAAFQEIASYVQRLSQ